MSEMVERVARAIDPQAFKQFDNTRDYCLRAGDNDEEALATAEWAHGARLTEARASARAAIEAMREPTTEMVPKDSVGRPHEPSILTWQEMIDAALE